MINYSLLEYNAEKKLYSVSQIIDIYIQQKLEPEHKDKILFFLAEYLNRSIQEMLENYA